ncbi:complex I NDUFA9 subunit family protein [Devosia sp.]|uniref:complex I NDUFA9 subunit family protein n=1 Tax=Devosia sp. TaxID=1871048 RepID=UPI003A8D2CFF
MQPSDTVVTVFGGSGFIGTQMIQLLARKGWRVRVAVRRPDLAGHVRPLGTVGQVMPIQANIRNLESVQRAVHGADIVINLVGVGHESGKQRFRAVHTMGARNIAQAATAAGVKSLVQVSAIGADTQSVSAYARSKALGEEEILAGFPNAIILRPSIVFGSGDGFFNLYGALSRLSPVLPLIGGKTRFQPVYVGDLAEVIVRAAEGAVPGGRIYEIGGPEVVTHREVLETVVAETQRGNLILPIPAGLGKLMAVPFAILPFPPLITSDQVDLLQVDNVVSDEAIAENRDISAFGIVPTAIEAIVPSYLWRFRKNGQFDRQTV